MVRGNRGRFLLALYSEIARKIEKCVTSSGAIILSNLACFFLTCISYVCTGIVIAKEAFNRKISLLISKLKIELKKKFVRCYVWSIAVIWVRDLDTKKI